MSGEHEVVTVVSSTVEARRVPDDLFEGRSEDGPGSAPVRVAVLGAAGAGVPHLRALASSVPGARVVAVQDDGDGRRLAELADHAGASVVRDPGEVVADPRVDAVVVTGPDPLPRLFDCLEAGLPAYVDPGRAPDLEELRALVSLEEAVGRRLVHVGFVRRHDPAHLALRRRLADAEVGRAHLVRAVDRGGGAGPAALVAGLDAVGWLLGESVTSARVDLAAADGPVLLTARTDAGSMIRLEVLEHAGWGHDVRCEVVGAAGAASLAPPPAVRVHTAGRVASPLPADATARFADAHRIGLTAWVRSLRSGRPLGAGTWDWYVAAVAAAAAVRSRGSGEPVATEPGPRPELYDAVPHRVGARLLVPRTLSD